jgi:hypothetical protein
MLRFQSGTTGSWTVCMSVGTACLFRLNSLTTPIFNVQSYHCARVEKTSDISIDIPVHQALHVLIISSFSSSLSRESKVAYSTRRTPSSPISFFEWHLCRADSHIFGQDGTFGEIIVYRRRHDKQLIYEKKLCFYTQSWNR